MMELGLTRRSTVRRAAGAAGALTMGGLLGGQAEVAEGAGLRAASPITEVTFMPWWPYGDTQSKAVINEAIAHFGTQPGRRGLRLTYVPGPESGGTSSGGVIAAILSGTGPDIVGDCCGSWTSYL